MARVAEYAGELEYGNFDNYRAIRSEDRLEDETADYGEVADRDDADADDAFAPRDLVIAEVHKHFAKRRLERAKQAKIEKKCRELRAKAAQKAAAALKREEEKERKQAQRAARELQREQEANARLERQQLAQEHRTKMQLERDANVALTNAANAIRRSKGEVYVMPGADPCKIKICTASRRAIKPPVSRRMPPGAKRRRCGGGY